MQQRSVVDDDWSIRRRMVDDLLQELRVQARTAGDPREVRLVETHISWVLVGPEVYKIKKPVRLPFLDFSTFQQREEACRAEIGVNRRLAPRTYLGVAPIRRTPAGVSTFSPRGPIIDWAVRMVRLDDDRRADVLLERGELSGDQVDRLALGIAAFHADAATSSDIQEQATAAAIERNVIDNFVALEESIATFVRPDDAWELKRWQLAFLRGHPELFAGRIAARAARDGHGDLRLEHVFFRPDGDFDVIDGIEFDERLRWADVCADVAFLAMDLARLGRVDLAERFLAVYARTANDYELYRVVDFYEGYRACVRAKIAALAAFDPSTSSERRSLATAEARRYLLLAVSAGHRPVLAPTLVLVAGGIASGKSTIAERLGEKLGAPVVDADRTRKYLLGLAPTAHAYTKAWAGAYDPAFSELVYAEVLRRADAVLASGRSVIVDASFRTKEARDAARNLASERNVPLRLFECTAAAAVCRARLALRDGKTSVSDGRVEVFDAFAAGFEAITELAPTEHFRIDTSGPAKAALAQVERELATWPQRFVS